MNRIEIAALVLFSVSLVLPVLCVIKIYRLRRFKKNAIVTNAMIRTIEKRTGIKGLFIMCSPCNMAILWVKSLQDRQWQQKNISQVISFP